MMSAHSECERVRFVYDCPDFEEFDIYEHSESPGAGNADLARNADSAGNADLAGNAGFAGNADSEGNQDSKGKGAASLSDTNLKLVSALHVSLHLCMHMIYIYIDIYIQ